MSIKNPPIILSASRMTDMAMYYPNEIIESIKTRIQKGQKIHTVVLWTKHPSSLLNGDLHDFLMNLRTTGIQLFIQLTITGMGSRAYGNTKNGELFYPESNVPDNKNSLNFLPEIIELTGKAERVRLRIDPIIKIKDIYGKIWSNKEHFQEIIDKAFNSSIRNFSYSFLESGAHAKVDKRFSQIGFEIVSPSAQERIEFQKIIHDISTEKKIHVFSCCVPHLPQSRCIDGYLLESLHDFQWATSKKEPKSRIMCGCTGSVDIGGWPPKKCGSGCLYCYSRPN
ncbi:MAG: hypothetical protein A2275_15835 [Bacteroidetes bacterium RIFOXYA12_FULL_35_11]|nr:MAG: hypothetical protein A2X01_05590 [Bacteroidetes bacterium GWF2_35_48]OFY79194.1 MAG: hypothetical protein A2275_15835 [Bacteroidetes bacterium RIFOXYA12_FULL_35_11]HBX52228.1 hypothetical protein [Bacteroidales bacterium]